MSREWEETTLADVSSDVAYGYTESASNEKVGPRFLRITDIQNGVVDWNTVPFCPISKSDHQKYQLHPGDIVVARTGNSTGENYHYRGTEDAVYASYLIRFRVNQSIADPAFVWYNMRTKRWQEFINSSKTGSAQAGANAKVLGLFPLTLPPLPEQRAIASILGALDDKIELNRRMNATLEGMARALFQSWFVDFDPVRAKSEGRAPSAMDAETAALFPSDFVDSELGPIPKGWEAAKLDMICTISSGKRPVRRTDTRSSACNIELYGGGGIMGYVSLPLYNKPIILTGRVGTLGLILRTSEPSWPSDNTLVLDPKDGFFDFTYFVLKGFDLITLNRGSSQPLLTQTDLRNQRFVLPPAATVRSFSRFAGSIFEQISVNLKQSRTLAALRDTLLPRLLSGELSVADISSIADPILRV
ncbi:MAG: restriction endonuclease subunit S [Verrucomicrobiota bacterium]